MATDVDIRIINSETDIKCMAKYHYTLKRKKTGNNIYQAVRNLYEISEEENKHKG